MDADNSVLLAVSMVDRANFMFMSDKRDQVDKSKLRSISQMIDTALGKLFDAKISNLIIMSNLSNISEILKSFVEDESFIETTTEVKQLIGEKLDVVYREMLYEAGKYYTDRPFEYNMKSTELYNKIVMECLDRHYYFGLESNL